MKALVYLLAARAHDLHQDRDDRPSPRHDEPVGPLATTAETAAAWRQWTHDTGTPSVMSGERKARPSEAQGRPTSA